MTNRPRATALWLTGLITLVILLLLFNIRLSTEPRADGWPPVRENSVDLAEENLFDVIPTVRPTNTPSQEASEAYDPENQDNLSTPEPTTGTELKDRGNEAPAPAPVTTRRESPVKRNTTPPQEQRGPSQQEIEQQQARRISGNTAASFNRSKGRGNTSSTTGTQNGNSGSETGTPGSYHGHGHGVANGGWVTPNYRVIPAGITGQIVVRATIDSTGKVVKVSFRNGQPPANSSPELREAVKREVMARRYTRTDNNAPDESFAIITDTFR